MRPLPADRRGEVLELARVRVDRRDLDPLDRAVRSPQVDAGRPGVPRVGEAGSLYLADPWHSRNPGIDLRRPDGSVERIEIEPVDPYACELEDFAAAVRGERPHPFGREDAVGQARTIGALYRAAEFGADAVP